MYESISAENRQEAVEYITGAWGATLMVLRGIPVDVAGHEGICARAEGGIVGVAMYEVQGDTAELLLLDCRRPGEGIGGALVERVSAVAEKAGCRRLILVTTNDNINALRFYQKRGFDMIALHRNAMDAVRRHKPDVPALGEFGIPLRHEIEMERILQVPSGKREPKQPPSV